MDLRQWFRLWSKLARQESELAAACDAAALPKGLGQTSREPGLAGAMQQVRAQLTKHLSAAEGLRAEALRVPALAPALARRRQQCEGGLTQLQASCSTQLAELQQEEADAAADYAAASHRAQQLLLAAALPLPPRSGEALGSGAAATEAAPGSVPPAPTMLTSRDLPPEVTAHDVFMQRHGPTGGWHPDDHAEFERILQACRGGYAHCLQLCCEELGLLHTRDDIAQHARWHEQLQQLQLNKRLAVQRWRVQKQDYHSALLEEQQQAEAAAQQAAAGEAGAAAKREAEQKEQQRAAVMEWKRARQHQQAEEQQRELAKEQQRRQQELLARQQRQQENQQLLEQRREEQQQQKQHALLSAENSSGSGGRTSSTGAEADPAARQRLRDRNQQLLQRRQQQVQRRSVLQAQQAERAEQLQRRASKQVAGAAERDPGRLLRATSATAMRQLAALSEEHTARDSGYIRHVPRRATPGWCRGAQLA